MSDRNSDPSAAAAVAARVVLALGGGYFLSAALVTLTARGLATPDLISRSDAVVLASMFGFLLYLVLLLWAFAERRLSRLAAVLGGGALLLNGAVMLLRGQG